MADKLPSGLYALIDDSLSGLDADALFAHAEAAMIGGAVVIQLRLKRTADRDAVALIRRVHAATQPRGVPLIVNDRVDLALVAGADGVHLGDTDLPVAQARKLLGEDAFVGATTRNLANIEAAKAAGADHVGLGPVFMTRTKSVPFAPLGLEGLAPICRRSPLPVVAIAGIELSNIAAVREAGAHCAAVGSALLAGGDVVAAARALSTAFASQ